MRPGTRIADGGLRDIQCFSYWTREFGCTADELRAAVRRWA
jgi:hypothetical protein